MTEMGSELEYAETLWDRVSAFDSRPDIGSAVGLADRLARYIGGDPIVYTSATSASFNAPTLLPDEPRARSALIHVTGAACFYRLDGTVPATSGEQTLPVGTVIYLTGQPSIKGLIFMAVGITACKLTVTYFD